jgi:2-succinyl-5-enolpyruvyl-6-hydroxy-3-cyclohexene-1-carboxylate synthase
VLLDNRGGGIFDFLPVATNALARETDQNAAGEEVDVYTRHIATPTGLDFADAAKLYGLGHERAEDAPSFRSALERALASERSCIVEVRGERAANVELHRRASTAVAQALRR